MTQSSDTRSADPAADWNTDLDREGASTRHADPMRKDHDQLHEKEKETGNRQEALLDEAVEETFPASDAVSPKRIT